LRAHPDAADSIEGIIDWWLPIQRYETARVAVERALKELVSEGTVEEVDCGAGRVLYKLASKGKRK
jgi:hypothetical protein